MTNVIRLNYRRRQEARAAEQMIRRCRAIIATYLPNNSGANDRETLNALMGVLDELDTEPVMLKVPISVQLRH